MRGRIVLAALAFAAVFAMSDRAGAEGAFAEGRPADIAKGGVASGMGFNYKTPTEAEVRAMDERRESTKTVALQSLCSVVTRFHDQCIAVSMDPKAGTPGYGWAIRDTKAGAERVALVNCERTAGPQRKGKCTVAADNSHCDGTAQ